MLEHIILTIRVVDGYRKTEQKVLSVPPLTRERALQAFFKKLGEEWANPESTVRLMQLYENNEQIAFVQLRDIPYKEE